MKNTINETSAPLKLTCPSCKLPLGDLPKSPSGAILCSHCKFSIPWDDLCWDACVDKTYRRDFARQWVLWEAGKLGDANVVYGNDPKEYFNAFLNHTMLSPGDLASKRILEIGYGHGRLLHQIQQYCPAAYGIDLAKPLKSAKLRPGSAIFANLFNIPFEPRQFDLVICRGVMHVTPDPPKAFHCIAEQVADNGMLYLGGLYEPGKGNLALRKLFPGVWHYPESVRLGIAGTAGVIRAVLECYRTGKMDSRSFKQFSSNFKLDVFDVIAPAWTYTYAEKDIMPWFNAQHLVAKKVGYGVYVGVKTS